MSSLPQKTAHYFRQDYDPNLPGHMYAIYGIRFEHHQKTLDGGRWWQIAKERPQRITRHSNYLEQHPTRKTSIVTTVADDGQVTLRDPPARSVNHAGAYQGDCWGVLRRREYS